MVYIPKNRLITNLYTNTKEFVFKGTDSIYSGYYWKTFEGKFYTGKNPNDLPTRKLEKLENVENSFEEDIHKSQIAFLDAPTPAIGLDEDLYKEEMIIRYSNLKGNSLNPPNPRKIPQQYYPVPDQEDYDLGVFTRYFLVKTNQSIYLEVNKEIYDYIDKQDPEWVWELYTPFKIQWTLTGEERAVYITNRNIVLIQEQRLKRKGFQEFLNNNYLKFWKSQ